MTDRSSLTGSRAFIEFLRNYSVLIDMQLQDIHTGMAAAVEKILQCISQVSDLAEKNQTTAEQTMLDVHFNPDAKTRAAMREAQAAIDEAFAEATSGITPVADAGEEKAVDRVRRIGRFSKSVEALSGVPGDFIKYLLQLVGILSSEDVIGQRLVHITATAQQLSGQLGYLLESFDTAFNAERVSTFGTQLESFVMQRYTQTAERKIIKETFQKKNIVPLGSGPLKAIEADMGVFLGYVYSCDLVLKLQLHSVKEEIAAAVSKAMGGILELNNLAEKKKAHSKSILVRDTAHGAAGFHAVNVEQHDADASAHAGNTGTLAKPVAMLDAMDKEIAQLVIAMMGELSIEDVVRQRIDHVIASLAAEEKLIQIIAGDLKHRLEPSMVHDLTNTLLDQLWQKYTMETEKACYEAAFGHRRQISSKLAKPA